MWCRSSRTSSSPKCELSITGSALWNASCTPSQNSWLLAAFPVSSLEWDATFSSWEKPSGNWSENRMLRSLKGHWGAFLVGVDSSTSEVLPYLVLTWCMNTSFLIICSFVAFLTPRIFSWLQTSHRDHKQSTHHWQCPNQPNYIVELPCCLHLVLFN